MNIPAKPSMVNAMNSQEEFFKREMEQLSTEFIRGYVASYDENRTWLGKLLTQESHKVICYREILRDRLQRDVINSQHRKI